jgi:chromate transporter
VTAVPAAVPAAAAPDVTFREALRVWTRIALLSVGGPAAQVALMHRILVDEKRWIGEERFLHALNYCMLLPGPEAQQLATYIGWLMHRTRGGIVAGGLFVLPGFVGILALSLLYAATAGTPLVAAAFIGVKAAALALVVEAVLRIGKRVLKTPPMLLLAAAAFVAIFFFNAPFPLIIVVAGLIGLIGGHLRPAQFVVIRPREAAASDAAVVDRMLAAGAALHTTPSAARAAGVLAIWGSLWLMPLAALWLALGPDDVFTRIGVFFSQLAVVTFGGAYAVLAYMAQEAVQSYQWLTAPEMLDGLGMAETMPGPLIKVVQFVAFLGAFRDPGSLNPYWAGTLASVLATWVTFMPCFLWIFLGAPYVEHLRAHAALSAALSAITASVVGVVLNLSIWFAIHVLFGEVADLRILGAHVPAPVWSSFDLAAAVLAAGAMFAVFRLNLGVIQTLLGCAALGAAYALLSG